MRQVKCPRCSKMSAYDAENPFRPFCSERCQTIDLGHWASEKYAIPTEEFDPSTEVNENSDDDDSSEGSPSKH